MTNTNFNMQAPKRAAYDPRIVHIVNLHDKLSYIDGWDGEEYEFPPGSQSAVPIAMAKNCLGNPESEDWGDEVNRLKDRYGFDRENGRFSNYLWEQLIASGKVHCPEFGTDHIRKVNKLIRDARNRIIAKPVSGEEVYSNHGAVPLSKDEFEKFRANIASLDLDAPADYSSVDLSSLDDVKEFYEPAPVE